MSASQHEEPEAEAAETGSDSDADTDNDRRRAAGNPMAAFGRNRDRNDEGEYIAEVDEAMDGDQLIVIFVYCDSDERKYRRATESSKKFEEEVIGDFDVATALQGTLNLKFDGTQLSRDIRKEYKLSNAIPQLVLMDPNGKVLYKATGRTNPDTLAKMINAAKERVAEIVADRDDS